MVLKLEDIELDFDGLCVLKELNLSVKQGEFVCLLGPSGCGKTSTLRVCAGLEAPRRGRVLINGQVMTHNGCVVPPEKRQIGLLFQDFALFPHLSVYDNVAFGLKTNLSRDEKQVRVEEVLHQVRMDKYIHAHPHQLSGGQQQRVALARALAPRPGIMLLDEPFSGLDSGLRAEIRDETLHILKENNMGAVMVTHDPEEAMYMSDRIVLMNNGFVVQEGPPEDLYFKPVDHFAASFFGEINIIKGVFNQGFAETPLGSVPAKGFSEGQTVDVLVRPEDINIQRLKDKSFATQQAHILASRFLGRDSLLHVSVSDDKREDTHLHARVSGNWHHDENTCVMATFDPGRAFVFNAY